MRSSIFVETCVRALAITGALVAVACGHHEQAPSADPAAAATIAPAPASTLGEPAPAAPAPERKSPPTVAPTAGASPSRSRPPVESDESLPGQFDEEPYPQQPNSNAPPPPAGDGGYVKPDLSCHNSKDCIVAARG